jgi:hypothetical protein
MRPPVSSGIGSAAGRLTALERPAPLRAVAVRTLAVLAFFALLFARAAPPRRVAFLATFRAVFLARAPLRPPAARPRADLAFALPLRLDFFFAMDAPR